MGQLNNCKAFMYDTPDYIILKSYRTIVSFIDKRDMALYDFSRYVYGYTPGRMWNNMRMYIDGLKIEGSETAFEVLRINYEMCSR